jgi:autotransporter adhesin
MKTRRINAHPLGLHVDHVSVACKPIEIAGGPRVRLLGVSALAGGALRSLAIAAGVVTIFDGAPAFAQAPIVGNNTSNFAFPTAPGQDSLAAGYGATASISDAAAFGTLATASFQSAAFGTLANASGPTSTAVGYQATATGITGTALGTGSLASGESSTAVGNAATATADESTAMGDSAHATGANSVAIGVATEATQTNAIALGNTATSTGLNSIAIGGGLRQGICSGFQCAAIATGNNSVVLGNGSTDGGAANVLSVGALGAERRIVNVAAGTLAAGRTDAVNGDQLLTANQRVAAAFGGGAGLDAGGQLTAPSYLIQGTIYNDVGGAFSAVNTQLTAISGFSTYFRANSTGPAAQATGSNAVAMGSNAQGSGANAIAIGTNSQATQSGSIAMGMNAASTGANAIAIGTNALATGSVAVGAGAVASNGGAAFGDGASATGSLSAAFGPGAVANAPNSVAIGAGSVASAPNTVSVGAPGAERRITNVAPGISQTDAVNVGQLQSVAAGVQSQIGSLHSQIVQNNVEARRGIAAVAALSPGIMPSAPGRTTVSVNGGFFHSETGVGIGVSHRLNLSTPVMLYGSYANAGGDGHVGRIGGALEF